MRLFLITGLILVAWAAKVQEASGQASARYKVLRGTIAGGGVIFSGSARFQLGSTVGQPVVAGANSVRFLINGGFWNVPMPYLVFTKAATGSDLTLGGSWTGGTVPGTGQIATWSVNSLGAGLTLNNPLSWGGMSVLGGTSDISINGSGPLTLAAAGMDMSSSPVNLAMNVPVILGANQRWNVNAGQSLITPGVIGGGGGLCKSGLGVLLLTNANTYTGGTTVNGGALALDYNPGDTPIGTLAGGTTVVVNCGGTLRLDVADALGYGPGIPARLNINGGLVTSANVANTTPVQNGGASFQVTLPTLNFTGGTLSSGTNNVGDLHGGSYLVGAINTLASSNTAVINAASLSLSGTTFTVAAGTTPSGVDLLAASILNDWAGNPESLTKAGPGVMVLNNANVYRGGTIVNGGGLALDYNPRDQPTGTLAAGTTLTVNNGGTLRLDIEDALGFYGGSLAQLTINGGLVTSANVVYPTPVQYGGTSFRVTLPLVTFSGGTLSSGANMLGDAYGGSYLVQGAVNTLASSNTAVINAYSVSLQNTTFTVAAGTTPSGVDLEVSAVLNNWVGSPQKLTKAGPGEMSLDGINTYSGPTMLNSGTLALRGNGSIAHSPTILIAGGATLDVASLNSPFVLGRGQTLGNSGATGLIRGSANTANGTVALLYTNGTPSLEVTDGTLTLTTNTVFVITNTGSQLAGGIYPVIASGGSGTVAGMVANGAVTVAGGGTAAAASLAVAGNTLELLVGSPGNKNPAKLVAVGSITTLNLAWPADHLGWRLETNSVNVAVPNQWFTYPGSTSVTNVSIPVDPTKTGVFFRMAYP